MNNFVVIHDTFNATNKFRSVCARAVTDIAFLFPALNYTQQ